MPTAETLGAQGLIPSAPPANALRTHDRHDNSRPNGVEPA
jgi:hypothetical protein